MGAAVAGMLLAVPDPASAAPGGPHPVTSWPRADPGPVSGSP